MIYSMIIATVISGLISGLTAAVPNMINNIIHYSKKIYSYLFESPENKVSVVGTIVKNFDGINTSFSSEYNAIMSMIIKKKSKFK